MGEATINADAKLALENLALNGVVPGFIKSKRKIIAPGVATATTLRAGEDADAIVLCTADNSVVTLPKASDCPGMRVTVVNAAASGAALVSVSPNAADGIYGTTSSGAARVTQPGTTDKDLQNTKSTAIKGDNLTLISDGGTKWFIAGIGCGIWATET